MSQIYKSCQSCGMPRKRDERGGGTNADGTKSAMYCSRCFVGGEFTQPHITAEEMKTLVRGKLRELGFPGPVSWFFARSIPRLARWNPRRAD